MSANLILFICFPRHDDSRSVHDDSRRFGEWTIIDAGVNICHPSAAVLTASHGVIHDDEPSSEIDCTGAGRAACNGADGDRGYGDGLACGVRIHAPAGHTVSFDFDTFNLERGFDFLDIYDGADETAPQLGHFTGTALPLSTSSTGQDLFVKFVSNAVSLNFLICNPEGTSIDVRLMTATDTCKTSVLICIALSYCFAAT